MENMQFYLTDAVGNRQGAPNSRVYRGAIGKNVAGKRGGRGGFRNQSGRGSGKFIVRGRGASRARGLSRSQSAAAMRGFSSMPVLFPTHSFIDTSNREENWDNDYFQYANISDVPPIEQQMSSDHNYTEDAINEAQIFLRNEPQPLPQTELEAPQQPKTEWNAQPQPETEWKAPPKSKAKNRKRQLHRDVDVLKKLKKCGFTNNQCKIMHDLLENAHKK